MVQTILVPLDDSPMAMTALEHACEEYPDARIIALHVIDYVAAGYTTPDGAVAPSYWEDWYDAAEAAAETLFGEAREVADRHGVALESETTVGPPARSIVEFTEGHDIDLVIMGSHGRKGVSRFLLGSVAEMVVRRSPVPVMVVR
jgi:nucleotide-binding universal stress UspA family protein